MSFKIVLSSLAQNANSRLNRGSVPPGLELLDGNALEITLT